ncbi:MAG: KGK domain-containing protein [Halothece sp.]
MNDNPEKLNGDEVICMGQPLIEHDTFKSFQFLQELKRILTNESKKGIRNLNLWISEGIGCELLSPNKNWRKGKLRIKLELEFIPDEPELTSNNTKSPLDDVRTNNI